MAAGVGDMPPKKPIAAFKRTSGQVRGWPYTVFGDGKVQVGTAAKGQPFERWSFRLTSYEDNEDRDACVMLEIQRRELPDGPLAAATRAASEAVLEPATSTSSACEAPLEPATQYDSSHLLGFEVHDMEAACEAFVTEAAAPVEPRVSRRRRTQPEQLSPSKGWSDYEQSRVQG